MFTGIIQGTALITSIEHNQNFRTHFIQLPKKLLSGLTLGSSVSQNGCCLTVKNINDKIVSFDIIQETLNTTTMGDLKCGDIVNIERAVKCNQEISGHLMSGHVFSKIKIDKIFHNPNDYQLHFKIHDLSMMKYILYKGFIGIDGISLTINNINSDTFSVNLIPETIKRTTLGKKKIGDFVNIELDFQTQSIVNTVENFLSKNKQFYQN